MLPLQDLPHLSCMPCFWNYFLMSLFHPPRSRIMPVIFIISPALGTVLRHEGMRSDCWRCGSGICVKSASVQPALLFCSGISTLLSSKRSEVNFTQTSFRNLAQKAKKEMNAWHEINLQISLFTDFPLFLKYISVNKSIYTGVHGIHPSYFTDHTYKAHPKSSVRSCTGCDYWLKMAWWPGYLQIHSKRVCFFMSAQYSTHREAGPPRERFAMCLPRRLCKVWKEKLLNIG